MKLYLKVVFFSLGMLLVNGCGELSGTRTLRLAHGLDVNHSVHKAMVKMGDDLKKISGGKMRLEIYPNQQLGTERQCLELLQIGSLDMTKVSVGTLENFAPKMKVLGLPFLFRDRQHSFNVLDGPIGQELLNDGEQYWLKGLGYYDAGSRSFYTKDRPINSPEDLGGLKIRVMESVTAMDMVKDLGGSPTPISWGELYTALQQGVVDGAENNPPSFYLSRHYEVCKFYTLDEHTVLPDVLLAGTHLWDSLSEEEQGWLKQAVDGSIGYQRKLWAESEEEALAEVKKAGVEIIRPDKSLFSEKIKDSFDKYKDDEAIYKLIQEIQATK
ncbi:tripartite ATP-independent transporter solute receptor, DctP family [Zobellia uliginosa]|uniref:Tripartite ATP-independent transporter solute receptor, DctP family n=1 Tax=Zobellia uliginosa TaxID=143224 RepID=A0ABY1KM67_9FLAO|nr:TRAP transporter substrate-binding protein [Zobellia uliginosa]SIS39143.1 tripartite ATP-independent transporter solute receptor, DctP family [Zobellia uliginosa]